MTPCANCASMENGATWMTWQTEARAPPYRPGATTNQGAAQDLPTAITLIASLFFTTGAFAQGVTCDNQAVGKDGKPLTGAAKTAFVKKCKKDACEPKAVSSDGKPLTGAAKNSFLKKCQQNA
jgi:hypothetical protein